MVIYHSETLTLAVPVQSRGQKLPHFFIVPCNNKHIYDDDEIGDSSDYGNNKNNTSRRVFQ